MYGGDPVVPGRYGVPKVPMTNNSINKRTSNSSTSNKVQQLYKNKMYRLCWFAETQPFLTLRCVGVLVELRL